MSSDSRDNPDFSIIIPTYNRCNYLKKAIVSVLKQKDVSFEIIISDNCSADKTAEIVKGFGDKRIKYFKNKRNIGFPLNVRKCLQKTSGKYVFTLSDDDFILYDNALSEVLKVMKKYKVGVANIGAINWSKSTKFPCRIFNLSNELVIIKPKKDKKLSLKALKINYPFYSGLVFDSSVINENQIIENYMCSFCPLIFDTARKYGLAYIPGHFIVARISLRFVPYYYNLDKLGYFFMDDYLLLIKQYLSKDDYEKHKKEYVLGLIINLPSIKLFTNNQNYIRILYKFVNIDNTLLRNPKFLTLALIGFMPKIVLKELRNFMIYLAEKRTIKQVQKYGYFQNLQK